MTTPSPPPPHPAPPDATALPDLPDTPLLPAAPPRTPLLPFRSLIPIVTGIVIGLLMRFVFDGPAGTRWSAMAGAFIWCAPLAIGATTVYLAERQRRRSWGYYLWAPAVATGLTVLGTLLILIEGMICAIVIVPLFAALGAAGGLCMGLVCRLTRWPRHSTYGFVTLPLVAALVLPPGPGAPLHAQVERSVWINAPASVVWGGINHIRNIQPHEVDSAWAYRIGVPTPIEAVTVTEDGQRIRKIRWAKGVHFDEVIQDWDPGRHLRWTFRFAPDSVPPGALDDHVAIGGAYFDMNDTAYTLTPEAGGTRLHLRISYRLSTDFNTYANWWAQMLLNDFAGAILQLYKMRSEAQA